MMSVILVTGGARSGKSRFAEQLLEGKTDVAYLATAKIEDSEMADRVAAHQASRPSCWRTFEGHSSMHGAVGEESFYLMDCLTVFTSNIMFEMTAQYERIPKDVQAAVEARIRSELDELIAAVQEKNATLIIVTNELGSGIVPAHHISRVFRDIAGRMNQYAASLSDSVYLTVSGIPVKIKG